MNKLLVRVISGLIFGFSALGSFLYWGNSGLLWFGLILMCVGCVEYSSITIIRRPGLFPLRVAFVLTSVSLLLVSTFADSLRLPAWGLLVSMYLTMSIWMAKKLEKKLEIFEVIATSLVGFLYCALLPAMAIGLLRHSAGGTWFLLLLLLVFCGDTMAYFSGRFLGKRKLFADLSPNKTMEGALGGLLGSLIATLIMWKINFTAYNFVWFVALALVGGMLAQTGDLFESLIKRVNGVKDSGKIMPGHGGVLDRMDGVLFAAPLVYFYAFHLTPLLLRALP